MKQSVGIICRLNAARSPSLEALLSNHNSNDIFFSGGVHCDEDLPLPKITKDFAKRLSLTSIKLESTNIRSQEEFLLKADVLMGADDFICRELEKIYPEKRCLSIEKRAREFGVTLVDPVNLDGYEFFYALGKFLYFGFSTFQQLRGLASPFPITALIANQNNIQRELEILLESHRFDNVKPLIVDCNFKFATKAEYLTSVPSVQQFETSVRSILDLNFADTSLVTFVRPAHEVTRWEAFVSSPVWRSWLINLSRSRPVILVCTPVDIIEGEKHNSFLEALNADYLIYRA